MVYDVHMADVVERLGYCMDRDRWERHPGDIFPPLNHPFSHLPSMVTVPTGLIRLAGSRRSWVISPNDIILDCLPGSLLSVTPPLSVTISVSLSLFLSVASPCISFSLPLSASLLLKSYLFLLLPFSLSQSIFILLSLPPSLCICISLSLPLSLYPSLSLFHHLYVCVFPLAPFPTIFSLSLSACISGPVWVYGF